MTYHNRSSPFKLLEYKKDNILFYFFTLSIGVNVL